jgi:hypothetical protein
MILETNELAVKAGVKTCNTLDIKNVRIVRIKNTLELKEILISEGLLGEIKGKLEFKQLTEPQDMEY